MNDVIKCCCLLLFDQPSQFLNDCKWDGNMTSTPPSDVQPAQRTTVAYVQQLKALWQKEATDASALRSQVSALEQELDQHRLHAPTQIQHEMLDFYETFDVYSDFPSLPEQIPRWLSRVWFDSAQIMFIFNTSNDNPMLASSFSNAGTIDCTGNNWRKLTLFPHEPTNKQWSSTMSRKNSKSLAADWHEHESHCVVL